MFNDVTLINKPLHERYATLEKILNPKESVVYVPKQNIVNTREQVEDALNKAIDESEEGLVVKAIDSVYEPGKRGPSWRKIKPEVYNCFNKICGKNVTNFNGALIV